MQMVSSDAGAVVDVLPSRGVHATGLSEVNMAWTAANEAGVAPIALCGAYAASRRASVRMSSWWRAPTSRQDKAGEGGSQDPQRGLEASIAEAALERLVSLRMEKDGQEFISSWDPSATTVAAALRRLTLALGVWSSAAFSGVTWGCVG